MTYEKLSSPEIIDFPQEWFDLDQNKHFWFEWRKRVLTRLLADNSIPTGTPFTVLEIGCGIGFLRQQIETFSEWTVDGADLDEQILKRELPVRGKTFLYRIDEQLERFKNKYDAVILFDVIEHIENPEAFLKASCWHLKQGGILLVNVPALPRLYSQYDRLVGHFRRYDTKMLQQLIQSQNSELEIIDMRYWGFFLLPIAWLRKKIVRRIKSSKQVIATGFSLRYSWMNHLFTALLKIENRLIPRPPIGTSLMALVRKKN